MKIIKKLKQRDSHYIIKMCGDYNDGDYSYSEEICTEEEFNKIAECLLEIKKLVGRDYCNDGDEYGYEYVSEHIEELQEKYKVDFSYPYGDTSGGNSIHSLIDLDINFIDADGKMYDVILED